MEFAKPVFSRKCRNTLIKGSNYNFQHWRTYIPFLTRGHANYQKIMNASNLYESLRPTANKPNHLIHSENYVHDYYHQHHHNHNAEKQFQNSSYVIRRIFLHRAYLLCKKYFYRKKLFRCLRSYVCKSMVACPFSFTHKKLHIGLRIISIEFYASSDSKHD